MSQFTQGRAVVVGVAEYQHINGLPNTVIADAQDIRGTLINPNTCGYDPERVELLLNEQATKGALRSALERVASECDEDSTFVFYVSSHGGRVESGEFEGEYLLPVETVYDDESLSRSSLSGKELADLLWGSLRGGSWLCSTVATQRASVSPSGQPLGRFSRGCRRDSTSSLRQAKGR